MRRLLCVAAVSGAVLLLGAGCSADGQAGPTAAPTPLASGAAAPATGGGAPGSAPAAAPGSASAAAPGSGDAALAGNSEAICQQAARAGAAAGENFAGDLKLLIDAESAQNAGQVAQAKAKTARDVENYSSALTDMARLASEPALKAALADMGKQVTALKGDVRKIDADRLTKLRETLDRACGKG